MTLAEIKTLLSGEQYDFLRTNPHLGNNIVLLTLGGSYAYGTNIESSDVDIRGCALNSPTDLLGLTSFEQVVETKTDTTIYSFNKLVGLLLNCNPNVIELLGCKPEHYLVLTDTGQKLLDNRKLFLSKRAVNSFGGYAVQQLRRLENALRVIREAVGDGVPVSVDTFRASVARKCVEQWGADIINDISGGMLDDKMFETVAELHCPYILMHMRGTPATMQSMTQYNDVTADVIAEIKPTA